MHEPNTTTGTEPTGPARRSVVIGAAVTASGAALLAACGGSSTGATTQPAPASSAPAAGSSPAAPAGSASSGGGALAKLSDVPVGGSFAAAGPDGKPIVIAQPAAGQVVAYSAFCTHAGCKVTAGGKTLTCPCHQSTFDAFTGKNLSGPAPSPLPSVAVKVSGTDVVAG